MKVLHVIDHMGLGGGQRLGAGPELDHIIVESGREHSLT